MKTPNAYNFYLTEGRPVPPHLRVGSLATHNLIDGEGKRRFLWRVTESDHRLAPIAGWSELVDTANTTAVQGCLLLPIDTRAASAALSGMQAFPGEKEEIITYIGQYAKAVYESTGAVDEGLTLDSVAITRGNEQMFALPPHAVQDATEGMQAWASRIDNDLAQVLVQDEQRDHLIGLFAEATAFARGDT